MRPLPSLRIGGYCFIQNQTGNHPRRFDKSGRIVEVLQHDQYRVRLDGSGRITLRNRRFLRKYEPLSRETPSQPSPGSLVLGPLGPPAATMPPRERYPVPGSSPSPASPAPRDTSGTQPPSHSLTIALSQDLPPPLPGHPGTATASPNHQAAPEHAEDSPFHGFLSVPSRRRIIIPELDDSDQEEPLPAYTVLHHNSDQPPVLETNPEPGSPLPCTRSGRRVKPPSRYGLVPTPPSPPPVSTD